MINVGLIGEDPNDTSSIKNLLLQKYPKGVNFIQLIKNVKGYQLDNERTVKALQIECHRKNPDIIIFIRDADGLSTEKEKIDKVKKWYQKLSEGLINKKGLLLNTYELEALIFADIEKFNSLYKTSIKAGRNVTFIKEPKEELIRKTRNLKKQYSESHCPELFKLLRISVVADNCDYFSAFLNDFSNLVHPKRKK